MNRISHGHGLPSTDSLGLKLVNNLIRQINGTIELERGKGTKFEIKFKELYK